MKKGFGETEAYGETKKGKRVSAEPKPTEKEEGRIKIKTIKNKNETTIS